jgi:hypothetical protein
MGYLVVVHVTSIDQARVIRAGVQEAVDGAKTVGVYRYPGADDPVCPGRTGGCKADGWTRAHPEGHMVHACGRRQRYAGSIRATIRGALLDLLGINLLPRSDTPATFRNPEGWDRPTKKRPTG